MKKLIFISLLFLTSIFSSTFVSAYEPTGDPDVDISYGSEEYDRIYYEDGYWHGVIEVTDSMVTGWNCAYYTCNANAIYLNFSRELIELESIKIDYTLKSYCDGMSVLGICFGTEVESETGSEVIFNEYDDGSISE